MDSVPMVKFYTKAGCSPDRLGACPFCQRVHMVLAQKSLSGILRFEVVRVNLSRPPPEFRSLGLRHVPALVHGDDADDAIDAADDIVAFLDERFCTEVEADDPAAAWAAKDFFSCFCRYIKEVAKDSSKLTASLKRLDEFLSSQGPDPPKFLCGNSLSHLDCEVLPKLQHVRVASKSLRDYDIPTEMASLWRYLHTAYAEKVFLDTCPCDQEIVLHWAEKPETVRVVGNEDRSRLAKEQPRFSFHVPAKATLVQIE